MLFPKPFILQVDNAACESFAKADARRSKLKHIDCRQEWIKILRDKNIMLPKHVDTKLNVADIFTKISDKKTFEGLVNMIMKPVHIEGLQLNLHKVGAEAEQVQAKKPQTVGPNSRPKTEAVPRQEYQVHMARYLKGSGY